MRVNKIKYDNVAAKIRNSRAKMVGFKFWLYYGLSWSSYKTHCVFSLIDQG